MNPIIRIRKYKIVFAYLATMMLLVFASLFYDRFPCPLCPFKLLTGLPCPGCGGLRAANMLLQGNVLRALYINPLSCIVMIFFAILPFIYLYGKVANKRLVANILAQPWNRKITGTVFAVILLNWAWNIYKLG